MICDRHAAEIVSATVENVVRTAIGYAQQREIRRGLEVVTLHRTLGDAIEVQTADRVGPPR